MDRSSPELVADELRRDRFPAASVLIVAGSVVRGEGTRYSDLDIVVLFDKVDYAYRQSLVYKDWPVECFVHDLHTLRYFFMELDAKSGFPALPSMVAEGIAVPTNELSEQVKRLAREVLAAGPPALSQEELDRRRYAITDLIDDMRDPRWQSELMATGAKLLDQMGDYFLRSRKLWSGSGKTLFRLLHQVDGKMAQRFEKSFRTLFAQSDATACIALAEELLAEQGGFLFDGYRLNAPAAWRSDDGEG